MASEWQLPEDGIIDQVAVKVAVEGALDPERFTRPVRLTRTEQLVVAALLAAHGCDSKTIAAAVHMKLDQVHLIMRCAKQARQAA